MLPIMAGQVGQPLSDTVQKREKVIKKLFTIYPTPTGKYKAWTLAYYLNGVRRREKFSTKARAEARSKEVLDAISNGEIEAASMTGSDKASLTRARELLAPTGHAIENAAAEYAEARLRLPPNVRLIQAVECYLAQNAGVPEIMATDAIDEMLARKRADECSSRWTDDLENRLGRFKAHFKCPLTYITGPEIDRWLQKLNVGARSKKNYRTAVSVLMTFAQGRGYLPADWQEMTKVGFTRAPAGRIQVWSPAELRTLLEAAETRKVDLVPWLAIRAFAGVRYYEMSRLHWEDIQRETNLIVLDSHITKTSVRRIIPLQPNLKAWLEPYTDRTGPIVTYGNIGNAYDDLLKAVDLPTRHNALRDSYASYRMAQTGYDKFKVAQECGNSPARLEASYRALRTPDGMIITPAVADTYFSIRPKIVVMEKASA